MNYYNDNDQKSAAWLYGNAIVPEVPAEFIKAYFEIFDLNGSEC